jgi:hypothetical protein
MRHHVYLVALENRFGVARFPSVLNRAGCRVTVVGNPAAMVCSSRFVQKVIPCDEFTLAAVLQRQLAQNADPKPWVILTDEKSLNPVAACHGQPWTADVFPVPLTQANADLILRKNSFMAAAANVELPIPPLRICHTLAQANAAANELTFPLFMKRDFDSAGAGVMQVFNATDVPAAFSRLSNTGPVLIQQMIHGPVVKTDVLYFRGKPMCWSCAYARQTWPGQWGPSCVREYLVDPRIEPIVRRIGALTGFHGLCGFDSIHDSKTGRLIVIEFNARLVPYYHLACHVGVDYFRAISDFLAGRFTEQRPRMPRDKPPIIYVFPQDLRRCISQRDLRGLLKWLPGLSQKDIPWRDTNLIFRFFVDYAKIVVGKLHQKFKRRHNHINLSLEALSSSSLQLSTRGHTTHF